MIYRYFCLERPPAPGAIPKGAINVVCFDDKMDITDAKTGINYGAWGFAEYDHPLSGDEVRSYELSHGVEVRCV